MATRFETFSEDEDSLSSCKKRHSTASTDLCEKSSSSMEFHPIS